MELSYPHNLYARMHTQPVSRPTCIQNTVRFHDPRRQSYARKSRRNRTTTRAHSKRRISSGSSECDPTVCQARRIPQLCFHKHVCKTCRDEHASTIYTQLPQHDEAIPVWQRSPYHRRNWMPSIAESRDICFPRRNIHSHLATGAIVGAADLYHGATRVRRRHPPRHASHRRTRTAHTLGHVAAKTTRPVRTNTQQTGRVFFSRNRPAKHHHPARRRTSRACRPSCNRICNATSLTVRHYVHVCLIICVKHHLSVSVRINTQNLFKHSRIISCNTSIITQTFCTKNKRLENRWQTRARKPRV